ncbi:hypothetical protein ACM66B_006337 [Microbotryomycetes sp. NB124-2]
MYLGLIRASHWPCAEAVTWKHSLGIASAGQEWSIIESMMIQVWMVRCEINGRMNTTPVIISFMNRKELDLDPLRDVHSPFKYLQWHTLKNSRGGVSKTLDYEHFVPRHAHDLAAAIMVACDVDGMVPAGDYKVHQG